MLAEPGRNPTAELAEPGGNPTAELAEPGRHPTATSSSRLTTDNVVPTARTTSREPCTLNSSESSSSCSATVSPSKTSAPNRGRTTPRWLDQPTMTAVWLGTAQPCGVSAGTPGPGRGRNVTARPANPVAGTRVP